MKATSIADDDESRNLVSPSVTHLQHHPLSLSLPDTLCSSSASENLTSCFFFFLPTSLH
ncbi:uncharacterized protein J3R85_011995 [Psidium guajava]|nr:uncharacterized protein J3R85_011995 [Psidium guajava]